MVQTVQNVASMFVAYFELVIDVSGPWVNNIWLAMSFKCNSYIKQSLISQDTITGTHACQIVQRRHFIEWLTAIIHFSLAWWSMYMVGHIAAMFSKFIWKHSNQTSTCIDVDYNLHCSSWIVTMHNEIHDCTPLHMCRWWWLRRLMTVLCRSCTWTQNWSNVVDPWLWNILNCLYYCLYSSSFLPDFYSGIRELYCNLVNIRTNLLFVSWQVYGNKITVNANVLIIICNLFS